MPIFQWMQPNAAFLYAAQLTRKPAYFAMLDVLSNIRGEIAYPANWTAPGGKCAPNGFIYTKALVGSALALIGLVFSLAIVALCIACCRRYKPKADYVN